MLNGQMMDYPLTIDRILEHAYRLYPKKQIVSHLPDGAKHAYSYTDLYHRTKKLANVLVSLGVKQGDRIGTFAWNTYQHVEMYYGIPGVGAVCHTLNIRLYSEQLAYIVNHAEDKIIFVDASLWHLFSIIRDQIHSVEQIIVFNEDDSFRNRVQGVLFYEELMAAASDEFEWQVNDERTAMGLCYTSGTTGDPKGALYSHRSMYLHTMGANQAMSLGIVESDTVLPVVPQFHAMAWGIPYTALMAGADLILPGPFLKPEALADIIESYQVTVGAAVPSIWNGIYQHVKTLPRNLSSMRTLLVGGSAMPKALIQAYENELGVNVVHSWGMTETSPMATISRPHKHHKSQPASKQFEVKARQGYPMAGIELRIVGDEGNELVWDGVTMGELQVRGPWVVNSYFKQAPSAEYFTEDGWFRTGDVATIHPDGFMRITDRTKDLVKSGGEWISTVAIESVLMAHPKIIEAAVIAIPDEKWTERPMAVVVKGVDQELSKEAITEFLHPQFAKFWLPDEIVFVESLPKTSVGKFDKKELRRQYAEGLLIP